MRGHIQADASAGKAASIFNGPTVHVTFDFLLKDFSNSSLRFDADCKKVQEMQMNYEHIDIFIIDEVNAMSAAILAMVDEFMSLCFNPNKRIKINGEVPPFGGKQMIFMGDPAQLPPVIGPAIHDDENKNTTRKFVASLTSKRAKRGKDLYRRY